MLAEESSPPISAEIETLLKATELVQLATSTCEKQFPPRLIGLDVPVGATVTE
jgi:hypothetical protein